MAKTASRGAALLLCSSLGAALTPGCVIRIGPGGDGEDTTQPDPMGGEGVTEEPTLTPEEEAAILALQNVAPEEFALKEATAQYAAAACSSLVESQIPDPNNVDLETVQQLFDQYGPIANDEALAWMSFVDPSILAEPILPMPNNQCTLPPYECKRTEICPIGDGGLCTITGCGKGKCPWCDLFGNLLYDGFCTYACTQGGKYWGYGFNLRIRFAKQWNGFMCFPFPSK